MSWWGDGGGGPPGDDKWNNTKDQYSRTQISRSCTSELGVVAEIIHSLQQQTSQSISSAPCLVSASHNNNLSISLTHRPSLAFPCPPLSPHCNYPHIKGRAGDKRGGIFFLSVCVCMCVLSYCVSRLNISFSHASLIAKWSVSENAQCSTGLIRERITSH